MATQSTIEWTEQTWNPTTGCTKVSPGCKNCYAEVMARRLHAMGAPGYDNEFGFTVQETRLEQPLLRKKPTTYFVNSMSDLFHESLPDEAVDRVFAEMAVAASVLRCRRRDCDHEGFDCESTGRPPVPLGHSFQVLTKRAERMRRYITDPTTRSRVLAAMRSTAWTFEPLDEIEWPLPNVWLGVSVEDQARADERIPLLLDTPAAVRFLSVEPMIGPVDLRGRSTRNRDACIRCGRCRAGGRRG